MGHRRKSSSMKLSESRMTTFWEMKPLLEPCGACGKKRYLTRKAAKAARKRTNQSEHLSVYLCGEHWHIGHTPWQIKVGAASRSNTLGPMETREGEQ